MDRIGSLEAMLAKGQDNALLRFTLGSLYLNAGDSALAVTHLERAVSLDPGYSAAWKLLGKALAETGATERAMEVYRQGIATAEEKGDKQASKEMSVFLRRLEKQS